MESYSIPSGVKCIGREAFKGCGNLKNVTIPESVTKIEDCAFSGCKALSEVRVPNSVTVIGTHFYQDCYSPFRDCPSLKLSVCSNSCAYEYAVKYNISFCVS